MSVKVVAITQQDRNARALVDVQDTLNNEGRVAWAMYGLIQTILAERDADPVVHGALQVALEHANRLEAVADALEKAR